MLGRGLRTSAIIGVVAGASLLLAQPAAAAEGIVNGGFDGTLAPWTVSGGIVVTPLAGLALITFETSFAAGSGTLSQAFTTTADGAFDYSFDAGRGEQFCSCGEPIIFEAYLDGDLLSDVMPAFGGFTPQATPLATHYAGSRALAAGSHSLSFTIGRYASSFGRAPYVVLDSVQGVLTPNAAPDPSGAPEPAAWALMILGFGAAGVMLRRRQLRPA